MPRIVLILLAIPLVLIVAAAILIPVMLNEDKLLAMAGELIEKETGATLVVDGGASLSVFPSITLELVDVGVKMPDEQEMSLKLGSLGIGVEWMPLLASKVEISKLAIDGLLMTQQAAPEKPALDTSTLTDAQLDAYYDKRRQILKDADTAAGQAGVTALPLALNVKRLSLTNSVLEIVSADGEEVTSVKIINLEATGLNLDDKAIPISLSVRVEGEEGASPINLQLEGAIRVDAPGQLLTLENVAIVVAGVLAEPATAGVSGVIDMVKQAADLQLELSTGEIQGEGSLRFASFETPQIDAKMHFNVFDPALIALAGPDAAVAASEDSASDEGDGDEALPLNAIRAIDTRATLSIDRASFSGHSVKNMQVNMRAVDGVVRINALTGTVHGGKLDMKANFNAKHNIAKLTTIGGVTSLDLAEALAAMDAEPIMTGKADLQWKLSSNGATSNQLTKAMKGPIDLETRQVVLNDLGIEKMLCESVALVNRETLSASLPESTQFENLSVKLKMNQGKLQMNPFRAELQNVALQGQGALDLLQQDFKATFTASLSAGLGELDPACRVNDRITAIGWPVNCKGSLAGDPADWCAVDSSKIIEDLATGEVQRQIEKEGSKLLKKLFN